MPNLKVAAHIGRMKAMREQAVEFLRAKGRPSKVIDHNLELFHELALSVSNGTSNGVAIRPHDLLLLALYHENFKSKNMLPPDARERIGWVFDKFVELKRLDMSEKKVWTPYSELAIDNAPLLIFRTIDLSISAGDKGILTKHFNYDANRYDTQMHNIAEAIKYVYAPYADILGLGDVLRRLKNRSAGILHPRLYGEVCRNLVREQQKLEAVMGSFGQELDTVLKNDIVALGGMHVKRFGRKHYKGRIKSAGSITFKLVGLDRPASVMGEDLSDLLAFTVVTGTVDEVYFLKDYLSDHFGLEFSIDDYIKNPRGETGYQSLHLNVLYGGVRVELQLKTGEMYERCEKGNWAHALYKPNRVERENLLRMSNYSELLINASTEDMRMLADGMRSDRIKVIVSFGKGKKTEVEVPKTARFFDLMCRAVTDAGDMRLYDIVSVATGSKCSYFSPVNEGAHYSLVPKQEEEQALSINMIRQLLPVCVTSDAKLFLKKRQLIENRKILNGNRGNCNNGKGRHGKAQNKK